MTVPLRPILLSRPVAGNAGAGLDRVRRLAWANVRNTTINQKTDASTDPTHSHWLHKLDLDVGYRLFFGRVMDSVAYVNAYKVQPERGMTTLWCTALTNTALQPMGSRQLGQIPVGAKVIFALHPSDVNGVILGIIPQMQTNSQSVMADFISQQARCGLLVDPAHTYLLNQPLASLITDWSSGRPFDATTEGEHGHITETGLLKFIDSFMTANRVDEECGVWSFYTDSLTRLSGHNLQIWSAGYEREDDDDEGEIDIVEGYTPYYWEALGAYDLDANVCRTIPPACWQMDPEFQQYSSQEPCNDEQAAFYRLREFHGYLGQAYKKVLCLPPIQACIGAQAEPEPTLPSGSQDDGCGAQSACDSIIGLNLLHDENSFPGVFEDNLSLTGRWSVRSAHEIVIAKHMMIPSPKQVILPQDPNGDNSSNYKAAGTFGSGPAHIVTGDIEMPVTSDDPSQIRAAGFLDTHAFVFNWINDHPFYYHDKDWFLPEESAIGYPNLGCQSDNYPAPIFSTLSDNFFMTAPTAIPISVDSRYGDVNYYPNHSYFALLEDGGVVIGDGFGAEIKMSNGHITLSAPGDINLQSGRDIVNLAGYDFIARAKNSWDMTATNADGRLQALNNLWLCASGTSGGILLQSNATSPQLDFTSVGESAVLGGIVLKADQSMVSICGNDLSFNLSDPTTAHTISFDAGWLGRVKFKSQYFERFLANDGAALDWWVTPTSDECGGTIIIGNEWWQNGAMICSPLVVDNKFFASGCGVFNDSVEVLNGHIYTTEAAEWNGCVGAVNTTDVDNYETVFTYFSDQCTESITIGATELEAFCTKQCNYNLCNAEFSFRTVDDYHTTGFVLFENRWQQLARISSDSVNYWTENEINDTYPYPGKENILGSTFRTLDLELYDATTGKAVDRGSAYETAEFDVPTQVVLNGNYPTIL